MCSPDEVDNLIDSLVEAVKVHNVKLIENIYETLSDSNYVESGFWREVYSESKDWEINIIIKVREKKNMLTIHDVCLIQNIDIFTDVIKNKNVDMYDSDACIIMLEEYNEIDKIKLIEQKINKSLSQ